MVNEDMERLHNFDLPCLKWGNQKLLRCMKIESNGVVSAIDRTRHKFSSSEKLKNPIGAGDEIDATREKLIFDFRNDLGKIKDAVYRERFPATTPTERPWNLRTRRAACSPANGNGEVLKTNCSPVRIRPAIGVGVATTSGEKRERAKFSVSVSRNEIEEDFMAMTGRRLPRKPKKRPRFVQKQLDTLFPGLWLSEITADLYKVPDEVDTGKR